MALVFAGPITPAHAISRSQADRIALTALQPKNEKSDAVVVFGLRHALGAKTTVVEAIGRSSADATTIAHARIGRKAWLFWEDLDYGAKFAHPSRLLLVDDRTGKPFSTRSMIWWPLINARDAPFIAKRGEQDGPFRIYARLNAPFRIGTRSVLRARDERVTGAATVFGFDLFGPPTIAGMDKTCVILMVDPVEFSADQEHMKEFWLNAGVPAEQVFPKVPTADKSGVADGGDLLKFVPTLPDVCQDVVVYIGGHANADWVVVGHSEQQVKDGPVVVKKRIVGPGDLGVMIFQNPGRTFKIILDGCAVGAYLPVIGDHANLPIIVASSAGNENSYYTSKGGTFTSALIKAMNNSFTTVAKDKSGADPAARLIYFGFVVGTDPTSGTDSSAAKGKTHPQLKSTLPDFTTETPPPPPPPSPPPPPPPPEDPPSMAPIQAEFVQGVTYTQYTATLHSVRHTFDTSWSLTPPADDPTCNKLVVLSRMVADWLHSESDGCHHFGVQHNGTVRIVATVHWPDKHLNWICTASYFGTLSGLGPQPGPCQPAYAP